jgi:hypothetical protein
LSRQISRFSAHFPGRVFLISTQFLPQEAQTKKDSATKFSQVALGLGLWLLEYLLSQPGVPAWAWLGLAYTSFVAVEASRRVLSALMAPQARVSVAQPDSQVEVLINLEPILAELDEFSPLGEIFTTAREALSARLERIRAECFQHPVGQAWMKQINAEVQQVIKRVVAEALVQELNEYLGFEPYARTGAAKPAHQQRCGTWGRSLRSVWGEMEIRVPMAVVLPPPAAQGPGHQPAPTAAQRRSPRSAQRHPLCLPQDRQAPALHLPRAILRDAANIYATADIEVIKQRLLDFRQKWASLEPQAVRCFVKDFDLTLNYLRVPFPHKRMLRTTNLLERFFREFRSRAEEIGCFGSQAQAETLFYLVLQRERAKHAVA